MACQLPFSGDLSPECLRSKSEENKVTKMIMIIVGIFVFCNTFQVLYYAITFKGLTYPGYIMFLLSSFLATFNSSINVVVYGIFNEKYRKIFKSYFSTKRLFERNAEAENTNNDIIQKTIKFSVIRH